MVDKHLKQWLTKPQLYIFSYFYQLLEFSLKPVYFTWLVKILIFMVFKLLENALNPCIFTHGPLPSESSPPNFCHYSLPMQKESIISPQGVLFQKSASQAAEGNYK